MWESYAGESPKEFHEEAGWSVKALAAGRVKSEASLYKSYEK